MVPIRRHRVFISYHDEDRKYKDRFVKLMKDYIIDRSVKVDDIDDANLKVETIRQRIRDNFFRDASVTVVLIGPCTWQRKHVDWEIGSSLRDTKRNSRCGLLGIRLPNHSDYGAQSQNLRLVPPMLARNCEGTEPYARVHDWPRSRVRVRFHRWIDEAFDRRKGMLPTIGRRQFRRNRSGDCLRGWQS